MVAVDYFRVIVAMWLILTFTVAFFVVSRFGSRRVRLVHDDLEKRQQEIWDAKNKIADEEHARKKEKQRLERLEKKRLVEQSQQSELGSKSTVSKESDSHSDTKG